MAASTPFHDAFEFMRVHFGDRSLGTFGVMGFNHCHDVIEYCEAHGIEPSTQVVKWTVGISAKLQKGEPSAKITFTQDIITKLLQNAQQLPQSTAERPPHELECAQCFVVGVDGWVDDILGLYYCQTCWDEYGASVS
eukprot:NODE_1188_length_651_cov_695.486711_g931_i0.p1 GENE.NODE_1188_length_651_cov_695.486711_g931_i0~~NODE_1188_length_651_cov_695.486711_g931_i0.p1  ORF type:complete len:137 (-),score=9.10 NODE_1188_length_651_cov_695.486711_g931_i0:178-588(-)